MPGGWWGGAGQAGGCNRAAFAGDPALRDKQLLTRDGTGWPG
jgi:hypothetical protein